ncbi:hypothetical protein GGI07_005106 [Coemansia sp. Benny D115]|nr:hypothetical protein GGI07_005106 [Coemansia sp. Benny D115]
MPAHLRKVEIKGKLSTAVINDLSNSNVEHVGKFDVETTIDGAANPKTFYSTTSKLFCGAQIESMFSLTLGGETRYLNTNDVEWTQLVYLELKDPIEYCWLVALVCRFPSLDTAVLYGISFLHPPDTSNWSFDVSDHRSAPLAPWPASIAKMSVSFLVQYQNPQVVSACIKRLLLRTTSLTHFHINFSDYLDLEVFADRFKPYYAHMNRLRFSYQSIYSESNVY